MEITKRNFPNIEKTFLMIKPDGIKRGLVGEIFSRLERVGLKVVASRMILADEETAKKHYPGTDEWLVNLGNKVFDSYENDEKKIMEDMGTLDKKTLGINIYNSLTGYLTEGPIIISVWEGNHAVEVVERIVGSTIPTKADLGSIRSDFGFDTPQLAVRSGRIVFRNLLHRSDSAKEAAREIELWFGEKYKDLGNYIRTDYSDSL